MIDRQARPHIPVQECLARQAITEASLDRQASLNRQVSLDKQASLDRVG